MMSKIYLSDTIIAKRKPFLYCICIQKPTAFVYIGQSSQRQGALGRFVQHLDNEGTLVKRAREVGVTDFEEITVVAVDLTDYYIFNGLYSRKRDALEFLIHSSMKAKGCKSVIPFEVISYVSNCSLIHDVNIQRISEDVTQKICDEIPFFKSQSICSY
jgi:hypothetical protein